MNIKTMNPGKLFGARAGENEWLLCRAIRFDRDTLVARIVGTGQEARFNLSTGRGIEDLAGYSVVYTDHVPISRVHDAIAYMSQQVELAKQ